MNSALDSDSDTEIIINFVRYGDATARARAGKMLLLLPARNDEIVYFAVFSFFHISFLVTMCVYSQRFFLIEERGRTECRCERGSTRR